LPGINFYLLGKSRETMPKKKKSKNFDQKRMKTLIFDFVKPVSHLGSFGKKEAWA
jgi:isochorismate hydrolase